MEFPNVSRKHIKTECWVPILSGVTCYHSMAHPQFEDERGQQI